MKKVLIIFCILFALALSVPAIACLTDTTDSSTRELVTIFSDSEAESA